MENIFWEITKFLLAISGLIAVVDFVGLMPPKIAKWLARNRLEATLQALKLLSVRVAWNEDQQTLTIIQRALAMLQVKEPAYKVQLRELLEQDTFEVEVIVGSSRHFTSEKFIDVMGSSTESKTVIQYARLLNSHASTNSICGFDVIATPKNGSPILGYEFSKLLNVPLVLGVVDKGTDATGKMKSHIQLDYPKNLSIEGKTILLVDDSSTGGSKILKLALELRKAGAIVDAALVLFEPKGKNARELLEKSGICLHSVIDGPNGRF
jgi:orotate phosphoribosyltransferase